MKVSIILPYYNRKQLLAKTLGSFKQWYSQDRDRLEVVIVDDGSSSDHHVSDLLSEFKDSLDILLIVLPQKQSITQVNPCYPYNVGVRACSGDIIVLSSPETFHTKSIFEISNNFNLLENDNYLLFSVFCCTNPEIVGSIVDNGFNIQDDSFLYTGLGENGRQTFNNENGSWYIHSKYRDTKLNFLSAITRRTYYAIAGFDERYRNGTGFDDDDFLQKLFPQINKVFYYDAMCAIHVNHEIVHNLPPTTNEHIHERIQKLPLHERYNIRDWGMIPANREQKIYVFGSQGMFGRYCMRYFALQGYQVVGYNREDFDATQPQKLTELSRTWPEGSYIINAIGIIPQKVKLTESAPFILINTVFPQALSLTCKFAKCVLIHLTTDCVYDGLVGMYAEGAAPTETNIYGVSKALGEPKDAMVIRTSIIGEELNGKLSLLEWLRSNPRGAEINGYSNHLWNGLTCLQLVKTIDECIRFGRIWKGVRHLVSPGKVTKQDLCQMISDIYGLGLKIIPHKTSPGIDKTLAPSDDHTIKAVQVSIPSIYTQIIETRDFSPKL